MQGWTDRGSPAPFSFHDMKHAYVSSAEFTQWLPALPVTSPQFRAAHDILEMCPLDVPA